MFNFLRNCQIVFQERCRAICSHHTWEVWLVLGASSLSQFSPKDICLVVVPPRNSLMTWWPVMPTIFSQVYLPPSGALSGEGSAGTFWAFKGVEVFLVMSFETSSLTLCIKLWSDIWNTNIFSQYVLYISTLFLLYFKNFYWFIN